MKFGRFEQVGALIWIYYGDDTKILIYPIELEDLRKALNCQEEYVKKLNTSGEKHE